MNSGVLDLKMRRKVSFAAAGAGDGSADRRAPVGAGVDEARGANGAMKQDKTSARVRREIGVKRGVLIAFLDAGGR